MQDILLTVEKMDPEEVNKTIKSDDSHMSTKLQIREIRDHKLEQVVDEISARRRYNPKIEKSSTRWFPCFDNDQDEKVNYMRFLAGKKIQNELDVTRIMKKIRDYRIF